jgi:hypothetical protein
LVEIGLELLLFLGDHAVEAQRPARRPWHSLRMPATARESGAAGGAGTAGDSPLHVLEVGKTCGSVPGACACRPRPPPGRRPEPGARSGPWPVGGGGLGGVVTSGMPLLG